MPQKASHLGLEVDNEIHQVNFKEMSRLMYPGDTDRLASIVSKFYPETFNVKGPWIAGGSIRRWWSSLPQSADMDIFCSTDEQYDELVHQLTHLAVEQAHNKYNRGFKLDGQLIQLIHWTWFDSIEHMFNNFDFTICQFAFDGTSVYATEQALADEQNKRLVPVQISAGASSLCRIAKYASQGYKITLSNAARFLIQTGGNVSDVDISTGELPAQIDSTPSF